MATMPSVTHVRGDTLSLGGTITGLPAGVWTATSQIRTADGLSTKLADLVATMTAPVLPADPWTLLLELASNAVDQTLWPLGTVLADVRLSEAGSLTIYHTTTFGVTIVAPVTV